MNKTDSQQNLGSAVSEQTPPRICLFLELCPQMTMGNFLIQLNSGLPQWESQDPLINPHMRISSEMCRSLGTQRRLAAWPALYQKETKAVGFSVEAMLALPEHGCSPKRVSSKMVLWKPRVNLHGSRNPRAEQPLQMFSLDHQVGLSFFEGAATVLSF